MRIDCLRPWVYSCTTTLALFVPKPSCENSTTASLTCLRIRVNVAQKPVITNVGFHAPGEDQFSILLAKIDKLGIGMAYSASGASKNKVSLALFWLQS